MLFPSHPTSTRPLTSDIVSGRSFSRGCFRSCSASQGSGRGTCRQARRAEPQNRLRQWRPWSVLAAVRFNALVDVSSAPYPITRTCAGVSDRSVKRSISRQNWPHREPGSRLSTGRANRPEGGFHASMSAYSSAKVSVKTTGLSCFSTVQEGVRPANRVNGACLTSRAVGRTEAPSFRGSHHSPSRTQSAGRTPESGAERGLCQGPTLPG
jgi:hypothetical protein